MKPFIASTIITAMVAVLTLFGAGETHGHVTAVPREHFFALEPPARDLSNRASGPARLTGIDRGLGATSGAASREGESYEADEERVFPVSVRELT